MRKAILLIGIVLFVCTVATPVLGQNNEFKPAGKVYGRVFSNFHESLLGPDQSSAFELSQAYFGYLYNMSPDFSAEIKLDIGDQEGGEYSKLKRYAYFKKAELKYHKNKFTARFGIISMQQFSVQEKFWEKKYVKKTYLDYYKFGHSADIGAAIRFDFLDNLTVDALVMNGEGYKNLQSDDTYKGGLGITFCPTKELIVRYYSHHMHRNVWQNAYSGFVGYKKKDVFSLAAEYNYMTNSGNEAGYDYGGFSFYGSYNLSEKWELFARYDQLNSTKVGNNTQAWNAATETGTYPHSDGQYAIGGLQFIPIKNVRIAFDGQYYIPAISTDEAALVGFFHVQFDL